MQDPTPETPPPDGIAPTYRLKRRPVMKVRVTWLVMVFVLCVMTFRAINRAWPGLGTTAQLFAFVAVVVVPMVALILWRAGLLPPERVRADHPEP